MKLARKKKNCFNPPTRFRSPTPSQIQAFNDLVRVKLAAVDFQASQDPFTSWAHILLTSAKKSFSAIPAQQRKPYISEESWLLLCQKQTQLQNGRLQEAKVTEKNLRKQIRRDKRHYIFSLNLKQSTNMITNGPESNA